jgi:pantothenate kinase
METSEIEEMVYSALINNETIMELLPNGESSIYHLQAPENYPSYPTLVYAPISDVPILHADNKEKMHRVTIRIHIVTEDGQYWELYDEIKKVMAELDFIRVNTTPMIIKGEKMLVIDFKKITGVKNNG